jgi:hypothetical protein
VLKGDAGIVERRPMSNHVARFESEYERV